MRNILAKYGWFQTVENDIPHFTYLGLSESILPTLGLQKIRAQNRIYWIPQMQNELNQLANKTKNTSTLIIKTGDARIRIVKLTPSGHPYRTASDGKDYTVEKDILMTDEALRILEKTAWQYFEETGQQLHITSGYRTAERQAKAMYDILRNQPEPYIHRLYANKNLLAQILNAYYESNDDENSAVTSMARVISIQIKNSQYISNHLLERAFDVRVTADLPVLRQIVSKLGGKVVPEYNNYHIEF